MDFFDYQRKARNRSKLMIIGVALATLAIVIAVDIVVLIFLGWQGLSTLPQTTGQPHSVLNGLFSPSFLSQHASTLLGSSAAVAGLIAIASLGKITSLRSGGAKVARQLGGDLVTSDNRDPLRRRLHNVVEEISIASGVPVPEVYVLEHEDGINAFAAGYSQSDAAIAVTRGTLDKLNRSELQGVVAHEFSHILNGDMRINIRMMGVIFGISVLAIISRRMIFSNRHSRVLSRNSKGTSMVVLTGFVLMLIGYIGLFFARWMKSALSRQREYLADASAIQFTREPSGLANALKKIAVHSQGSYLAADSEEISHMLFGDGERPMMFSSKLFATHPPLMDRVKRIEPHFDEGQLLEFGKRMARKEHVKHEQIAQAEEEREKKQAEQKRRPFEIERVLGDIGHPELEQILAAAVLADSLPDALQQAARSVEWAPEVVLFSLLDSLQKYRDKQLLVVAENMGEYSEKKLQYLINNCKGLTTEHRLPLLEIVFPELKRRPIAELEKINDTIQQMIQATEHIEPFEYLLTKVIELHIQNAQYPNKVVIIGNGNLQNAMEEAIAVLSVLAKHGHSDLPSAQKAFDRGMQSLGAAGQNMRFTNDWVQRIDQALIKLNKLQADDKRRLIIAMSETVMHDGKLSVSEHELLRAICATLHVPLPLLA